jgi:hypothetical protein
VLSRDVDWNVEGEKNDDIWGARVSEQCWIGTIGGFFNLLASTKTTRVTMDLQDLMRS